jgi:citrate lyase subunit beta-like protein
LTPEQVPGSDDRKLQSALKLKADTIVFDLEDGVPLERKAEARQKVLNALEVRWTCNLLSNPTALNSKSVVKTFELGMSEKAVRINCVGSGKSCDNNVME